MSNTLENEAYVAGALAAATGNILVELVARSNTESTAWYRVYDPARDQCHVVVTDEIGYGEPEIFFCEACSPHDKMDFTQAFLRTLRFGEPESSPSAWLCILADGWVDQEWIDLELLRAILEKGAAELQSDFKFDIWAVNGLRPKAPKQRRHK
jgi:hypothetical protein